MKIYLAHNFAARDWLRGIIPFFETNGHTVVSNWVTDDRHLLPEYGKESAVQDFQDIEECGAIIFFAEQFGNVPGEGKYVELGYAIRAGKRVIVVGEGRCVFYHLSIIRQVGNYEDALIYLGGKIGGS